MSDRASAAPASRPLSPHLQIWRFTATMASSITHRGTGMALYAGTILLAFWLFAAAQGPAFFWRLGGFLSSPLGWIILGGYIWALSFHMMNGLRFLYWDSGRGMAPSMVKRTSWLVYLASFALAVGILILGAASRGGA